MDNLIVIISQDFLPTSDLDGYNYLIIRNNFKLIDHHHLLVNDKPIYFDYLIIDQLEDAKTLDLLIEDQFIITNTFLESSIERIFAFGNIVLNLKSKSEQLKLILDYITNPL